MRYGCRCRYGCIRYGVGMVSVGEIVYVAILGVLHVGFSCFIANISLSGVV